jgi:hypothetical protein
MNDYVGFALFQAESLLPRDTQAALTTQVMELLKPLRPLLEPAPFSRGAA